MSGLVRLTGADIEGALVAAGIPHSTPLWEVDWDAVAVELNPPEDPPIADHEPEELDEDEEAYEAATWD